MSQSQLTRALESTVGQEMKSILASSSNSKLASIASQVPASVSESSTFRNLVQTEVEKEILKKLTRIDENVAEIKTAVVKGSSSSSGSSSPSESSWWSSSSSSESSRQYPW